MADINGLMQDSWKTSDYNEAGRKSYLAMRRLLDISPEYFHILEVCFNFISVSATADNDYSGERILGHVYVLPLPLTTPKSELNLRYCLMSMMTDLDHLLGRL